MWRHVVSNVLTLAIVVLFLVGGVIIWGANTYSAQGPLDRAICLQVQPGSTMRRVSANLADQGAITSPSIFRMGADYADKTSQLKAGSFLIPEGASMESIVDTVTRGGRNTCGTEVVYRIGVTRTSVQVRELDPETNRFVELVEFNPAQDDVPQDYIETKSQADTRFRIALAEGVTSWTIVEGLKSIDLLTGDITEIPPEGSLAPDSYEVSEGQDRAAVLQRMSDQQARILAEAWETRAEGLPLNSPEEALILASIVEKETAEAEERRQVASVFINRLNRGMKLQTDPTVIYGITKGQGVLGRGLRRSELRAETPWNTYVIDALPPTPIANPGRLSIQAALNPDTTPYIFFVANGTGGHTFSVTLEEHNRAVAVWRQIEAERAAAQENSQN